MNNSIYTTKQSARAIIIVTKWQPVILGAVYSVIALIMSNLSLYISGYDKYLEEYMEMVRSGVLKDIALPVPGAVDFALLALIFLLTIILSAGFDISMLLLSRGRLAKIKDLFDGFAMPWKIIALSIMRGAVTAAGFMLFIVPGIALSYRYKYAIQALYDEPAISPLEALRRSARITAGHKLELFMLDLSFIGWRIASYFVAAVLFDILDAWVLPFVGLSFAVRYNQLIAWQPTDKPDFTGSVPTTEDASPAPYAEDYSIHYVQTPVQAQTQTENPETEAEPVNTPEPEPEPEKPAPDVEYWKARALRLQRELQEKDEMNAGEEMPAGTEDETHGV